MGYAEAPDPSEKTPWLPSSTDHPFLRKHFDKIAGVLSCFDRLIFRGHLPLSWAAGLEGFLFQQKILLKDFRTYAPQVAQRIKEHVQGLVQQAGAEFRHLRRKERMEEQARRIAKDKGIGKGVVCGFSQLETCRTFRCDPSAGRSCVCTAIIGVVPYFMSF